MRGQIAQHLSPQILDMHWLRGPAAPDRASLGILAAERVGSECSPRETRGLARDGWMSTPPWDPRCQKRPE
jgi:hypothetical protein